MASVPSGPATTGHGLAAQSSVIRTEVRSMRHQWKKYGLENIKMKYHYSNMVSIKAKDGTIASLRYYDLHGLFHERLKLGKEPVESEAAKIFKTKKEAAVGSEWFHIFNWVETLTWEDIQKFVYLIPAPPSIKDEEIQQVGNKSNENDFAPDSLYKYCPFKTEYVDSVVNSMIWFSKPKNFNDPFDCQIPFVTSDLSGVIDAELSISCFSTRVNSILMWSHYADKHTGFCLEYNPHDMFILENGIEQHEPWISPVYYVDNIPPYKHKNSLYLAVTKTNDWKYEAEYRMLLENVDGPFTHEPKLLKAVYFGIKADNKDISNFVKRNKDKDWLKYYRCVRPTSSFEIKIEEMPKASIDAMKI